MTTATLERSIDLACPRHQAFEKLSRFDFYGQLPTVVDVTPLGGNRARFVEEYEGRRGEFDVELDQVPEERVDMRTVGGPPALGSLRLEILDDQHTRLNLHAEYDQALLDQYQLSREDADRLTEENLGVLKSYLENPAG